MSIFILVTCITSCQPTPKKEVVVNKADGGLQKMIEASPAPTQEIEVEERWKKELQKDNVYIHINAEVVTPDVEKYPVLSITPIIFNQELADKAIEVFFKDAAVYDRKATKQYLEKQMINNKRVMERIKAGDYSGGFSDKDYDLLEQINVGLMDEYKTVLDEKDLSVSDKKYKEEEHGMMMLELMGKVNKPSYAYLYVVDNILAKHNLIQFYNNGDMRSCSTTEYAEGTKPNGVLLTVEEARQIAYDKIAEMGITGVKLSKIQTANFVEVKPIVNREEIESDKQAYDFVYEKVYKGINVTYFNSRMKIRQTENDSEPDPYNAHLRPEELQVMVDDSGVVFFDWKHPASSNGVISENVKLLDFEKIKEIFMRQIFYHQFYGDPEGSLDINIDRIVLSYFVQPVKNENDKYIAMPVWDFVCSNTFDDRGSTYLTINAIDGSVINRRLGY